MYLNENNAYLLNQAIQTQHNLSVPKVESENVSIVMWLFFTFIYDSSYAKEKDIHKSKALIIVKDKRHLHNVGINCYTSSLQNTKYILAHRPLFVIQLFLTT